MQEMVYLLRNGVPLAEQRNLSATRRWALCVAFGEMDGAEYDWSARRWKAKQ